MVVAVALFVRAADATFTTSKMRQSSLTTRDSLRPARARHDIARSTAVSRDRVARGGARRRAARSVRPEPAADRPARCARVERHRRLLARAVVVGRRASPPRPARHRGHSHRQQSGRQGRSLPSRPPRPRRGRHRGYARPRVASPSRLGQSLPLNASSSPSTPPVVSPRALTSKPPRVPIVRSGRTQRAVRDGPGVRHRPAQFSQRRRARPRP